MKVTKEVKKEVIVEETEKVLCDCCEKEIDKEVATVYEGHGQLKLEFGYGSRFDGCEYQGDFCDECSEKLIEQFKLKKTRKSF